MSYPDPPTQVPLPSLRQMSQNGDFRLWPTPNANNQEKSGAMDPRGMDMAEKKPCPCVSCSVVFPEVKKEGESSAATSNSCMINQVKSAVRDQHDAEMPEKKPCPCVSCTGFFTDPDSKAETPRPIGLTSNKSTPTPITCSICEKRFKSLKHLEAHMCVHSDDKPYVCETCLTAFNRRDKLRRHMLTHDPFRHFRCDLCDGAFKRKDKLKRHMVIHNPEKEFKCPYRPITGCTREFNRADKLKTHLKRVHEKNEASLLHVASTHRRRDDTSIPLDARVPKAN